MPEGVAIRLGPGDTASGDGAAGAGRVLDHHLLPEGLGHALPKQTCDRIGWAACRERHDHRDDAVGIIRLGCCRAQQQGGHDEDDAE